MAPMTIELMPVDGKQRLTSDMKKALQKQIESVLDTQGSLASARDEQQKERMIEEYAKAVGRDDIVSEIREAKARVDQLTNKLGSLGFTTGYGSDTAAFCGSSETRSVLKDKDARAAYQRVLDVIKQIQGQERGSMRAKIIARLWMAKSVAEAQVIFTEVAGNGLMPIPDAKLLSENTES